MTRRICVVTGSRAEYGLLQWTMRGIAHDPALDLQVAVTGAHLANAFGHTVDEIVHDGFEISARVDLGLGQDSELAAAHALGRGVGGFAEALAALRPHLLVVLGDRYEILAAAQAALLLRIPIAHIHGGELTEGAIDEAVRHALTKMSHIHCVAAEAYARRVIQMGEQPESVHVVGATGLDPLTRVARLARSELEGSIGLTLGERCFLVTLHPETLSEDGPDAQVDALLEALGTFPDAHVVITGSNADPAGRRISDRLREYARTRPGSCCYHTSLGQQRYLSVLDQVDVVIGNSSSGIIEAPAAGKPVVNIGDRQRSRLRAPAVIDCTSRPGAIRDAIRQALAPEHRALAAERRTPYGSPGAAERIVRVLRETPLDGILRKRFYDLPERLR